MFNIKEKKREDNFKTISRGVTFLQNDKSIIFEFSTLDGLLAPIDIYFKVSRNTSKKPLETEITDLKDRKVEVTFYNPSVGSSGLIEPGNILQNDLVAIRFMFHIEALYQSEIYRLTYEFFEQPKN